MSNSKVYILFLSFLFILELHILIDKSIILLNEYYTKAMKSNKLLVKKKLEKKINIGIISYCLRNGGRARVTSLLVNFFYSMKIFNVILITQMPKEAFEYMIPTDIKRITFNNNLKRIIKYYKINIIIYELDEDKEMNILNNLTDIKVIFYQHSSIFYYIYTNYTKFKNIYNAYQKSKYLISIVPFENNYLFKKWGIPSIYMDSFVSFNYDKVIPSSLSENIILLIGRGKDPNKRFHLGIQSMEYIKDEILDAKLFVISNLTKINNLENLVNNLNINEYVEFIEFTSTPEIYFKNSSINYFLSISESFGLVLFESKIYNIPNILMGIDYVSISKGGTFIIYDDQPESLAKLSINILKNVSLKKQTGKFARRSVKYLNNNNLFARWIKLFNDDLTIFTNISNKDIIKYEALLRNQIKILQKRIPKFYNITIKNLQNFQYLLNIT